MFSNQLPINHLRAFSVLPLESCVSRLLPVVWGLLSGVWQLCSIIVEESLQIAPFFAKRTQFQKGPNERKVLINNVL